MIKYYNQDIIFKLSDKRKITKWISEAISEENYFGKGVGEISIVFTSDSYLRNINKKFLKKSYFTDIITFDNSAPDKISADLLISVDRVKVNAIRYKQTFMDEIHRVIIHGILHLTGYNDEEDADKEVMTQRENYYLNKRDWLDDK
ncbi:MAG: rRNA maturation RNase YbeY [Bacteroidales bacterium]|nr:rRNA maturation RNase YbeY [Bacteroidales bacterium]